MVRKGDGPTTITCNKDGYKKVLLTVDKTITGATFGNIIIGGGTGILVVSVSGAAQQYPDTVYVWMEPEKWDSEVNKAEWMKEKEAYLLSKKKNTVKEEETEEL